MNSALLIIANLYRVTGLTYTHLGVVYYTWYSVPYEFFKTVKR